MYNGDNMPQNPIEATNVVVLTNTGETKPVPSWTAGNEAGTFASEVTNRPVPTYISPSKPSSSGYELPLEPVTNPSKPAPTAVPTQNPKPEPAPAPKLEPQNQQSNLNHPSKNHKNRWNNRSRLNKSQRSLRSQLRHQSQSLKNRHQQSQRSNKDHRARGMNLVEKSRQAINHLLLHRRILVSRDTIKIQSRRSQNQRPHRQHSQQNQ